ncbi:hypothetical protein [Demequina globuliformis]|uniref:hypothetical protein n=1 Tax=Demequina globuliformis TaxID=676202 RepID=UPI0007807910|nr:hypothetical protein [Demequina globuliformis]
MARGFQYAPGASDEVAVAQQPVLHRTEMTALSQSRNVVVREAIAARDDLPLGVMVTMAHDRATDVRAALAGNPRVSATILEHLAGDRHVPVLEALLANPVTPLALVERLAFHRKDQVRLAAAARLNDTTAPHAAAPRTTAVHLHGPIPDEHVPAAVPADELSAGAAGGDAGASEREDWTPEQLLAAGAEHTVVRFPDGRAVQPAADAAPQPRPTRTAPIRGFRITD